MATKIYFKQTKYYQFSRIARQINVAINHLFSAKGFDITIDQWAILNTLQLNDGLCQNQLAESTGKDRSSITRIIDSLEKETYLYRESSLNDRRNKLIFLTNKGREAELCLNSVINDFESELNSKYSVLETQQYISFLDRVSNSLNSNNSITNKKYQNETLSNSSTF